MSVNSSDTSASSLSLSAHTQRTHTALLGARCKINAMSGVLNYLPICTRMVVAKCRRKGKDVRRVAVYYHTESLLTRPHDLFLRRAKRGTWNLLFSTTCGEQQNSQHHVQHCFCFFRTTHNNRFTSFFNSYSQRTNNVFLFQ